MNNKNNIQNITLIITTQIIKPFGVVEYHPVFMKGFDFMVYNEFKITDEIFTATLESWMGEHSRNFHRVETDDGGIKYTNSHGDFVEIKQRNTKFGELWEKQIWIGNTWLCTWDTKLNRFSSLDEENLDQIPYNVGDLIKEFRKHEKVYEFHTGKYDRWDD